VTTTIVSKRERRVRREWRKEYKACQFKLHVMNNVKGNVMCTWGGPIVVRCMYAKCPLVNQ